MASGLLRNMCVIRFPDKYIKYGISSVLHLSIAIFS